jgi:hypothetical protein
MRNIFFLTFLTSTVLLSVVFRINLSTVKAATIPTVAVNPQFVPIMDINETFTLNVTVTDAESMHGVGISGFEIRLEYDPTILEATNLTEGPFLRSFGETFIAKSNITDGHIWFTEVLMGSVAGATGNGTLLTVNFTVTGTGASPLHLTPYDAYMDRGTHLADCYVNEYGYWTCRVIVPEYVDSIYGWPITVSIFPTEINVGENVTINGSLIEGAGPDVSLYYRHTGETAWTWLANVTAVNKTYSYIWVKPDAGTYEIKAVTSYMGETVESTVKETYVIPVIPEFPAWGSMLFILIMLTAAVTIYKRTRSNQTTEKTH